MLRIAAVVLAVLVPVGIWTWIDTEPDKNPYSFEEMKGDAQLALTENRACEKGRYNGKVWKTDYCIEARRAFLVHRTVGRISPDGTRVKE